MNHFMKRKKRQNIERRGHIPKATNYHQDTSYYNSWTLKENKNKIK